MAPLKSQVSPLHSELVELVKPYIGLSEAGAYYVRLREGTSRGTARVYARVSLEAQAKGAAGAADEILVRWRQGGNHPYRTWAELLEISGTAPLCTLTLGSPPAREDDAETPVVGSAGDGLVSVVNQLLATNAALIQTITDSTSTYVEKVSDLTIRAATAETVLALGGQEQDQSQLMATEAIKALPMLMELYNKNRKPPPAGAAAAPTLDQAIAILISTATTNPAELLAPERRPALEQLVRAARAAGIE
jgi:hypothetical protein